MASNDRAAVGFLAAMSRAGIPVPESVSLVGYDDTLGSRLAHVNLTTVSQDAHAQAQHAVALAVERLDDGRTTPRAVVLTPALIIRGTTGSPPATGARMRDHSGGGSLAGVLGLGTGADEPFRVAFVALAIILPCR
jgi:Periplasmic binding protein-like domain